MMNKSDQKNSDFAVRLDAFSLALLIVAMCTQLDLQSIGRDTLAEGLGYATKTLKIALPDVALLACFAWFIARTATLKAWKKLWWPPLPCWALIFAMLLSALHSPTILAAIGDKLTDAHGPASTLKALLTKESKEAIAEIIQFALYFLVAPWLFVNLMHDNRASTFITRRRFALATFAAMVSISILIALLQMVLFTRAAPRAFFGSANLYGGFLAMAAPLVILYAVALPRTRFVSSLLLALGLVTLISLWGTLGMVLGVTCLLAFLPRAQPVRAFCLALALLGIALGLMMPTQSRAEYLRISSPTEKVKKQYVEWQAAQGWSSPRQRAFATGVGPGNYQINIGSFYGGLPNEAKMPPDSNNLYLVQAVSIGVLGLGALLWVIAHFAALAWRAHKKYPDDFLGAAVLSSLAAWLFVNLFHAMMVRGAGIVLAFVLALAVIALQHDEEAGKLNATQLEASGSVKPDLEVEA